MFRRITRAGSKGPCRHFNTSIYPANQIALFEASKRKTRTRSISRLVNTGPDPEHVVTSLPKRAYLLNDMLAQPKSPFRQPTAQLANPQIGFSPVSDFESIVGGEQREFAKRHLALRIDENISSLREKKELNSMLSAIGVTSVEELINQTVPKGIRLTEAQEIAYDRVLSEPMSELQVQQLLREYSEMNKTWKTYIGQGWSPCETPSVIANNVLRNPAWNTAYTPYQAEISQGRLESLFNFQTMIVELTGLPLANASLLDEATACAEAMNLIFAAARGKRKTFYIDNKCHPQNIQVMQARAALQGYTTKVVPRSQFEFKTKDVAGCIVQYPDTDGTLHDYENIVEAAHKNKSLVAVACDPLALTVMKTPGEFDADVAVGTTQRFGIPLWLGGPHAAFFATKEKYKRMIPARIVGKTIDSQGNECFRLALQTREQHIKRERATSNVCTAQALLANGAAFYGVYHGPEGLKTKAKRLHHIAKLFSIGVKTAGHGIECDQFFDTVKVQLAGDRTHVFERADAREINLRRYTDGQSVGVAFNDLTSEEDLADLLYVFGCEKNANEIQSSYGEDIVYDYETYLAREKEDFMTQEVFNKYHSEQAFSRYARDLELKDLSLVDSMIPLGSCTMKLNSSTSLDSMSFDGLANVHPLAPENQQKGWWRMLADLEQLLCEAIGFDAFFLQPNSGAQGELAGLATIKNYHKANGEGDIRSKILIPTSAHGTNPASANLCGYKIVPVNVMPDGSIDVQDLDAKINKHNNSIAGCMITYPSTYGVFDANIKEICDKVHSTGGQVYLDGANMNAQVGICRPGDYGADVSHLNLHKTFSGPHGGGGPGAGPIGIKKHLIPHLPKSPVQQTTSRDNQLDQGALAGTAAGSPLVLAISWAYIKLLGAKGLRESSQLAVVNANYMKARLQDDYNVLFKGENGHCAHEFIIDIRPFKEFGIEAVDVAKRLQDFGLHAGTMSWPVTNTLMLEPTESENKEEMDQYCDALLHIREEIRMIERGDYGREDNPLKNSPHTMESVMANEWSKSYPREVAAFPMDFVRKNGKHWPTVGRANDVYGDQNLVCSCEGMENYKDE
jgi:glycine dehydrogenase